MKTGTKIALWGGLAALLAAGIWFLIKKVKPQTTPYGQPPPQYPPQSIKLQPLAREAKRGDKVYSTNSRNIFQRVAVSGAYSGVANIDLALVKTTKPHQIIGYFMAYHNDWSKQYPFAFWCSKNMMAGSGDGGQKQCEDKTKELASFAWDGITLPSRGIMVLNEKPDGSGTEYWVGMGEDNYAKR